MAGARRVMGAAAGPHTSSRRLGVPNRSVPPRSLCGVGAEMITARGAEGGCEQGALVLSCARKASRSPMQRAMQGFGE